MHRLPGGALEQVVEAGDQHQARPAGVEREADVAVVCVQRVLDLGQARRREDAHEGAAGVEVAQALLDFLLRERLPQVHIDGRQDAARDGQQVRGENELGRGEPELLQDFSRVPVGEDRVGAEVRRHLDEVRLGSRLLAGARDPRLRVGDDAALGIHQAGAHERRQRQDDRGRIAAGVRHYVGLGQKFADQLRQAVDGLLLHGVGRGRVRVGEVVSGAVGGRAQAPGGAQVNHPQAAAHRFRQPSPRRLVRRGQE